MRTPKAKPRGDVHIENCHFTADSGTANPALIALAEATRANAEAIQANAEAIQVVAENLGAAGPVGLKIDQARD